MDTHTVLLQRAHLLLAALTDRWPPWPPWPLYPDAHAGWLLLLLLLLMLHNDNFNICHWIEWVDLQQHPDPNKGS